MPEIYFTNDRSIIDTFYDFYLTDNISSQETAETDNILSKLTEKYGLANIYIDFDLTQEIINITCVSKENTAYKTGITMRLYNEAMDKIHLIENSIKKAVHFLDISKKISWREIIERR